MIFQTTTSTRWKLVWLLWCSLWDGTASFVLRRGTPPKAIHCEWKKP